MICYISLCDLCEGGARLLKRKFSLDGKSFGLAKKVRWNFHRTISGNNDTMGGYIMKGIHKHGKPCTWLKQQYGQKLEENAGPVL